MLSTTINSMECKRFMGVRDGWDCELIVAELKLEILPLEEDPVNPDEEMQREIPAIRLEEPVELYIVAETDTYSPDPDLYYATYESRIAKLAEFDVNKGFDESRMAKIAEMNMNEDYGTVLEMHHDSHEYLKSLYKEYYKIAVNMMLDMFLTRYTPTNM